MDLKAQLGSVPTQGRDIAHPASPETEVKADADAPRSDLSDDHMFAKLAICHRRHRSIEAEEMDAPDAETFELNLASARGHQTKRRRIGLKIAPGRRFKCRYIKTNLETPGSLSRALYDGAVPGMKPVKIAQRDGGACWHCLAGPTGGNHDEGLAFHARLSIDLAFYGKSDAKSALNHLDHLG